jgi:hypothetical protein
MTAVKDRPAPSGAALQGGDSEARRVAARLMGSASTERKRAAAAVNGAKVKNPGRKPKPLSEFVCTCGRGDELEGHPTTCPRGLNIYRRRKAGKL